jgi:hypothetical protein
LCGISTALSTSMRQGRRPPCSTRMTTSEYTLTRSQSHASCMLYPTLATQIQHVEACRGADPFLPSPAPLCEDHLSANNLPLDRLPSVSIFLSLSTNYSSIPTLSSR